MSAVERSMDLDLDAMFEGVMKGSEATAGLPTAPVTPKKPGIQKLRYTHLAMIDVMIANPGIRQNALAEMFERTPSWISTIIASDSFQMQYAKRVDETVGTELRDVAKERMKGMMLRSLDILEAKLDQDEKLVPDNLALRALELSSRALGYGAKSSEAPAPVPAVGEVHVHLESLGGALEKLIQQKRQSSVLIEATPAEFIDIPDTDSK